MAIVYNSSVVRDGLVLHLDAANPKSYPGSGTVWRDLSGLGNNGTLLNGAVFVSSNLGNIAFDGVNDYVSVPNSESLNPSTSTLVCWAKSNTATWNSLGFLMSKRDVFVMHPNSGVTVSYYYRLNNTWQNETVTVPDITQWNMYACTWDGTAITAFLNGIQIRSGNKTGPLNTSDTGEMTIGRDDGQGRYMNGSISYSTMYNRALSAAEIRQNFNALRGRYGI
jgi:hypothetical protein